MGGWVEREEGGGQLENTIGRIQKYLNYTNYNKLPVCQICLSGSELMLTADWSGGSKQETWLLLCDADLIMEAADGWSFLSKPSISEYWC